MVWKETWRLLHTVESRLDRTERLGKPRPLPKEYVPHWRSVYDRLPKGLRGKPYHCPPRLKKLAKPKNYHPKGYLRNRLKPFEIKEKALKAEPTERLLQLSHPRAMESEWMAPRYPYWFVNPKTLKYVASERLEMLSRPIIRYPAHPVASSFKQRPAGVAYLANLAQPRPRHPEFLPPRMEFWKMTDSLRKYEPSEKILSLSTPIARHGTNIREFQGVTPEALKYVASERMEELAIPPARRLK